MRGRVTVDEDRASPRTASTGTVADPRAIGARSRSSRLRRAASALLVSTLAGFAIAEIVCRAKFGAPLAERLPLMEVRANKLRGFEMIPSSEHYTYEQRVRVNNLGLRGDDVLAKEPGEVRVLALGDSMTYGQGMGETETLPHAIEIALQARAQADASNAGASSSPAAPDIRVINGGVRSYNTEQELGLLEEMGDTIRPDVVVLFWFANDVDDPGIEALCARLERSGPIVFDFNQPNTTRAELAWRVKQFVRHSALVMRIRHVWTESHWPELSPAALDKAFEKQGSYLRRFAELAQRGQFDFVVAVIPLARIVASDGDVHPLTERMRALAAKHGFPFLDLVEPLRALRRSSGRLPVLAYDGHYDAPANAALGASVAESLWKLCAARLRAR
jgi:lysophospholipase L1-like esterase